jgi:transcriptional regulator with XRE-family HTH domain
MPTTTDLGRMLREARERRGISLRELSNSTKIAIRVLEALEANDISRLPGGIFGRGFVRSYAVGVGLDPETVIHAFLAQFPDDSVKAGHPTARPREDDEALESRRKTAVTFVRLVMISVPVLGVLLYFSTAGRPAFTGVFSDHTEPSAPTRAADTAGAVAPVRARSDVPLDPEPLVDRLAIVLSATKPCLVTATVDGAKVLDAKLDSGDTRALDVRRDLVLMVDDGGAVTMTVNGEAAKALGAPSEAVTVRVDLTNFRTYLSPR